MDLINDKGDRVELDDRYDISEIKKHIDNGNHSLIDKYIQKTKPYNRHKEGGVDVVMNGNTINAEGGELIIQNEKKQQAIIPRKFYKKVKKFIEDDCHSCIDDIVKRLPQID